MSYGQARRAGRRRFAVWAFSAVLLGTITSWHLYELHDGYVDALRTADATAERLSRALELHTRETIAAVKADLTTTSNHLATLDAAGWLHPAEVEAMLKANARDQPYLRSISLFGVDGQLIASSRGAPAGFADASTRTYFQVPAGGSTDLFIGDPIRSALDGQWIVPLSRRVVANDGRFLGVLVATIDPRHFQGFFECLHVGSGGIAVLASRDGVLLLRTPYDEALIGRTLLRSALFRTHLPKAPSGTFRTESFVDGVDRVVGYRLVGDLSLVVLVGISADESLAKWRQEVLHRGLVWLLMGLGIMSFSTLYLRQKRREDLAEEVLRESEARFRNMAEQAPIAVWVSEPDGSASYINRRWAEITGQPVKEGLGFGWLDCLHPDDRDRIRASFDEVHRHRASFRTECRLRRADGGYGWAIDAAAPRFGSDGAFLGLVGSVIDISERKAAEAAQERLTAELQAERRLLQAIIDNLPTGLAVTDARSGRLVLRNAEARRLLGRPPEPGDAVRDSFLRLEAVRADGSPYRADEYPTIRALLHGTAVRAEEIIYRRPGEGEPIILSVNSTPVRDEGDGCALVVTTFHDITERKAMEEALRDSRERLSRSEQHLIRAQTVARTGSWELDLRSGELLWSAQIHELLGLPKTFQPTLDNALALLEDDARDLVRAMLDRAADGTVPDGLDARIIRPDGAVRLCRFECGPRTSADGEVTSIVGTLQDVTDLRLGEMRRLELERQLQQAQKMEALGTLAGGIAHELNNALVPVLGLTEMMLNDLPPGSPQRSDLEMVVEGAGRARDLVRRILAFSRQDPPERRPVDLAEIVVGARELLRRVLPVTIDLDCNTASEAVVLADASQLHQVIVNLVTNAAQAIGDRPGTITISLAHDDEGVRLSVEDTGCGMDEATRTRVFEPFFTTKPVGEGTGLGLSVVHGIVAGHGGSIEVRSRPGAGAVFKVTLPGFGSDGSVGMGP